MTTRPPLPELDGDNEAFWTSGATGSLRIDRCQQCGLWLHPPRPACRRCRSIAVAPEAVAGIGTVVTYTINRQQWLPGLEVPYPLALVELDEQPGLRLATRLVDVELDDVRIRMRVRVRFERVDDVWLPVFGPEPFP